MADPSFADLAFYYTGAGSNSTTSLSIGGDISSVRIRFQACTGLTTLTGVTLDDGFGNLEGDGTLSYTVSTTSLTWTPYGGSAGTAVDISADGTYFVQGANDGGGLCITVVAASLPTANTSNTVTVVNNEEKWYLDQTKAESLAGVTKYHCWAVKNVHATLPIIGIKLWIAENTPGQDTMSLFLDSLAAGDGATTSPTPVADENTAPAASTFVTPDSKTHASVLSMGDLTAAQVRFFWTKQTTPAAVTAKKLGNTFKLGLFASF